jgi:alkylhydroperoxidase family enzyme
MSTSEGRVPRLSREDAQAAAEAAGVPTGYADLSVFQVLLRHPSLARALADALTTLLFRGRLDARRRELVIMRLGWSTGSVYEWTQHWSIAQGFGVAADELLGVRDWERHPGFAAADRAVLAATDETRRDGRISAATWRALEEHLPDVETRIELVAVIGVWGMVAELLRSLEVPLEEGVEPWPPDGVGPDTR